METVVPDRADALTEARAADAANYVRRYAQFTRDVERLKLGDGVASSVFPAAAWMLALYVLVRTLLWLRALPGGDHSPFARATFFFLIFGAIAISAGAVWLASREARARKRDQAERIREIADRHGVEPGRPRME